LDDDGVKQNSDLFSLVLEFSVKRWMGRDDDDQQKLLLVLLLLVSLMKLKSDNILSGASFNWHTGYQLISGHEP